MITNYPYALSYIFTALKGAPDSFEYLLQGLTADEADLRPDANRFTIREIMAHLADWDEVFLGRLKRTRAEDDPTLDGYDMDKRAASHYYGATDVREQVALFRVRRARLVAFLRELETGDWARSCVRPEIGRLTMEELTLMIPLHDSYHVQQVMEWLTAARKA